MLKLKLIVSYIKLPFNADACNNYCVRCGILEMSVNKKINDIIMNWYFYLPE